MGDEVWYAGDISRPGSNAEFQLVDERIVGHKPQSLTYGEAAALPLTSLTAWELLFDRMQVEKDNAKKSILVIVAYFVILHVSATTGVMLNLVADTISVPYFMRTRSWDVVIMITFLAVISLSKLTTDVLTAHF